MDDLIEVAEYDPAWPAMFHRECEAIRGRLPAAETLEHIGSTAIPGLAAKPTIDIMVGVKTLAVGEGVISGLADLRYRYLGEYGIPGRHFFPKGGSRTHHVHWVRRDADFWQKQLVFRDYLRANPQEASEYEGVKRRLAERFHNDRDSYTRSKTDCVLTLLERAWQWRGAKLIVLDLEAACWKDEPRSPRMETIEIGAVRLDASLRPEAEFSRLIKPRWEPALSEFCRGLTSITQADVDSAEGFPAVFADFVRWIGPGPFRLASWSDYDLKQLQRDCLRHGVDFPAPLECHLDMRSHFARRMKVEPCPMTKAFERLGLTLEGVLHRALPDARNIAKVAQLVLKGMRDDSLPNPA
ncbi:MAG: GrpB family protein [Elusimicrobia bacterium]|nr:GrpB family protein [Elusimicrobiota bacterium]